MTKEKERRGEIVFQQVAYRPGKLGAHLDQEKEARGGTSVQTQSLANMWGSYVTFLSYSFYFPSPALVGVTDAHPCLCMATSALELPLLLLSGVEGDSGLTLDLFLQSIDLSAWSQGPPFFLKPDEESYIFRLLWKNFLGHPGLPLANLENKNS